MTKKIKKHRLGKIIFHIAGINAFFNDYKCKIK